MESVSTGLPSSQRTPAFSVSMQSNVPTGSARQSRRLDSLPRHATLSNRMVPALFVKPVVSAAAPIEKTKHPGGDIQQNKKI